MINVLSVATNGYLSRDKKQLSIAVDGYLSPFVYFEITKDLLVKSTAALGLQRKKTSQLYREDEELLLIIEIFLKVWH